MENCIENKHKKFNIFKSKVFATITMLIVGFVMMLCFACNVSVSAATRIDKSLYNTDWTKANVDVFVDRWHILTLDKTYHYLRITDKDGKFIENITDLEATFIISSSGKKYQIDVTKSKSDNTTFFEFGNVLSKEGQFSAISASKNNSNIGKTFENSNGDIVKYQECNYQWKWNFYVEKIVYLNVWYLDPNTGKKVAGSFMPNGEHPLYNEDGTLKGIFDVDNNLVEDMTLNDAGIPSKIEQMEDGTTSLVPIIGWNDQVEGSTTTVNTPKLTDILPLPWPGGNGSDDSSSTGIGWLDSIILILELILLLIIIVAVVKFIKLIIDLFKK